ncbi:putative Cytohesin-1 [Operophtera brumata]|uniref:Putative Cytohesin-1 n=1 Tax=Operophtera brumata TaxID=104452 RepID=A0A0L7LEN6_OPEBR|nr:putative Cytohesin-1 [Operophtera brumata]
MVAECGYSVFTHNSKHPTNEQSADTTSLNDSREGTDQICDQQDETGLVPDIEGDVLEEHDPLTEQPVEIETESGSEEYLSPEEIENERDMISDFENLSLGGNNAASNHGDPYTHTELTPDQQKTLIDIRRRKTELLLEIQIMLRGKHHSTAQNACMSCLKQSDKVI